MYYFYENLLHPDYIVSVVQLHLESNSQLLLQVT